MNQRARSSLGASQLAVSPREAAQMLGVHRNTLDRHIMGELRVVYVGRRRLIPVAELERWLDASSRRAR